MYFPEDMTFQYFFFDTYPGYFLQMVPIALLVGVLFFIFQRKKHPASGMGSAALASLFPAYLASLLCLTLFMQFIHDGYYVLFYHTTPWPLGEGGYRWFTFIYDFDVDFFRHFTAENLGNVLLFLPFGFLYPLFHRGSTWKRTLLVGILTSLIIENIQPLLGRSFDLNDVILNAAGVAGSTFVFYLIRRLCHPKKPQ